MKTLLILSLMILGLQAEAKKQKIVVSAKQSKLTTDARFDGTTVGGKIQAPLEALSVVENEKEIDDLIGVRKNFRDRSDKAKGLR